MIAALERVATTPSDSLTYRAQRLIDQPIRFVPNQELADDDVALEINNYRRRNTDASTQVTACTPSRSGSRSPGFARMSETPPLEPGRESEVFRQLNLLKFEADRLRTSLDPLCPSSTTVDQLECLLAEADKIRDLLIRANIRLVMSIAKRFTSDSDFYEDLVSEGTIAVMNAVEHFDYQRGFRFSTYATQAVRRCYYRMLAKRAKIKNVTVGSTTEMLDSVPGPEPTGEMSESAVDSLRFKMRDILSVLDTREQTIIQARFGMKDRKPSQTLQKIANQLGVCKERVRQLEQRALRKLRERASDLRLDEYLA
jgi:RNA polymerase primary sigma factor